MHRDTYLLMVSEDTPIEEITAAAEQSAAAGAYLEVLLHFRPPSIPYVAFAPTPYGGMHVPADWPDQLSARKSAMEAKLREIEAALQKQAAEGEVRALWCEASDLQKHVELSARTADLALFAHGLRADEDAFREMLYGVLFRAPIGAMLNAQPGFKASKIFVAWDQSPAASRAIHMALPMLKQADEVTVACFDPPAFAQSDRYEPGAAMAAWLSRHDCDVSVAQYATGGVPVSAAIQERAKETGAELVVLGAYGHARMHQAVFGGTTRSMIEDCDMPMFLAH
ncbi:MAG: universal stress protein [Pseudomonadota bacterium]